MSPSLKIELFFIHYIFFILLFFLSVDLSRSIFLTLICMCFCLAKLVQHHYFTYIDILTFSE